MTNQEILQIAIKQSAMDIGCQAEDFCRGENEVVIYQKRAGARNNLGSPSHFCSLISYGNNTVASVDERIADAVANYIRQVPFYRCFEPLYTRGLANILLPYGMETGLAREGFLPDLDILRPLSCSYPMKILTPSEFAHFYTDPWTRNALCHDYRHLDVLAIGAYDGNRLIGLAGCSADCAVMWQIGIDVLPDYRKQGVASALTSTLACEVLKQGKIPYYCCVWANIPSARNAMRSGFRPAWAEMTAASIKPDM